MELLKRLFPVNGPLQDILKDYNSGSRPSGSVTDQGVTVSINVVPLHVQVKAKHIRKIRTRPKVESRRTMSSSMHKKSCEGECWHQHPEHPCLVRHAGKSEPLWPKFAFFSRSTSQSKTLGNLFDSTLPSQWEDSRLRWAATNYENVSKVRKNASSFKRLEKKYNSLNFLDHHIFL